MVEYMGVTDGARASVALATSAQLPGLDRDTRLLLEPLAGLGIDATPQVWDDASVDWSRFDLTLVRSCWDYVERRTGFLMWAASVGAIANPAEVLAWNSDKRYLAELAGYGFPVVPTTWLTPGWHWDRPDSGLRGVSPPSTWPAWTPRCTSSTGG